MRNPITAAATPRTRAVSIPAFGPAAGNGTEWTNGMPLAPTAFRTPRITAPSTLNHRFTDVVPAPEAGRGVYAATKQGSPPRGEPR